MPTSLRKIARDWRWGRRPLVPAGISAETGSDTFPTEWARSPAAIAARSAILKFGFSPLVRFETAVDVQGVEALEDLSGPVIFVANHTSHLDAPLVLTSLPVRFRDRIAVGAAADYFFDVWWRAAATALAFSAFPVDRAGSQRSPGLGKRLLEEGWSLLVFPEGTRSRDGWMAELKPGAASLSLASGAPILPVAIRGAYQAMPRGRGWPAPGRKPVTVRFGDPVWPDGEDVAGINQRVLTRLATTMAEHNSTWWEAMRRKEGSLSEVTGPQAAHWRRVWEASAPVPGSDRAFPR